MISQMHENTHAILSIKLNFATLVDYHKGARKYENLNAAFKPFHG